ncbi:MAG: tetratricopeptide repeat protein [Halioglobus sp.]
MSRLFAFAITCALLTGCAAQPPAAEHDTEAMGDQAAPAAKPPERPFPDDSLYELLVAEFALRRQAYDVTLNNYLAEAPKLRDAGVSEHTTHLAQFMQRGDAALQSAQLWVELEPDSVEANNTLAGLLAQQGRTTEALPYLVKVERETGEANFAMLLNGFDQLNESQRTELVNKLNQLAVEYPQNTRLLLAQALVHAEYKQFDMALESLDSLLTLEPEQPQALLLEARILKEQNADNPYARVEKVLQEHPDASRLRLQYARLLTGTDMDAAREQFEILSEQSPQDGELLFSLALINREVGDLDAARNYLHETIALGQRKDEAYFYLGRIAEEADEPEQAVSSYMQVGIGPEYLAASSRIGQILVAQDELSRSHTWFNEQREDVPQLREQLYGLEADILSRGGYTDKALELLTQALKETPQSTSLRYARAMLSEQQDDLAAMEKDLRILIAADPDNTTALNALGYTLADRTTRYEEALELVSRALELQPDEPAILDSMGWVLFRTGRYDEAVDYLTRAYAVFPDPEVAAHLGEALWVTGDTKNAIIIWQGAIMRDPDHPVLLKTFRRLGVSELNVAPVDDAPTTNQP